MALQNSLWKKVQTGIQLVVMIATLMNGTTFTSNSKDWEIANWVVFLGMANSVMNPFIYAWQRRDFKMACKRLLACKGPAPTSQRSNDTRRAAF